MSFYITLQYDKNIASCPGPIPSTSVLPRYIEKTREPEDQANKNTEPVTRNPFIIFHTGGCVKRRKYGANGNTPENLHNMCQ